MHTTGKIVEREVSILSFFSSSHCRNVVSSYSDIQVRVVQFYFYLLISLLLKTEFHGREEKALQVAQCSVMFQHM